MGVDDRSLVYNKEDLVEMLQRGRVRTLAGGRIYRRTGVCIGHAGSQRRRSKDLHGFKPIIYLPAGFRFKTYALKTSELHPEANIPCNDPALELQLKTRPFKFSRVLAAWAMPGSISA